MKTRLIMTLTGLLFLFALLFCLTRGLLSLGRAEITEAGAEEAPEARRARIR